MPEGTRLRVLVVGATHPLETFLARLFGGLAGEGVDVALAIPRRLGRRRADGDLERTFETVVVPDLWTTAAAAVDAVRAGGHRPSVGAMRLAAEQAAILRRHADVLYFPWNSAAIRHLHLLREGPPAVLSCRGSQILVAPHNPERAAIATGLGETFELAAAVHCVSEQIRSEAAAFGLSLDKATVIRPAVPLDLFRPRTWEESPPATRRIAAIGGLSWRKGYEYALVALRLVLEAGTSACLTIVGEGPDGPRLHAAVRDLGLADNVELIGARPPGDVARLLARSDLLWLPSLAEGISNAALEAMASGVPVVTTDVGGMPEAVEDGVTGALVPPRDPSALARATLAILGDRDLQLRMGRAARERAERDFDLDDQVRAFARLLRRAAEADA
jgi:glycosyltransferase involved in cell wall biosynthesis